MIIPTQDDGERPSILSQRQRQKKYGFKIDKWIKKIENDFGML